ncbi:MAG: hypothetical protein PHF50_01015 [Patescibacteria group bacterium]|nr:hypothetical protein [Patescibacteria group bacterium]
MVTHRDDVDGIISAALRVRFLKTCGEKAKLIFCSYLEQEQVFAKLARLKQGYAIYVSDIDAKDYPLPSGSGTVLGQIAAKAEKLEWDDHHSSTKDFIGLLKICGHEVFLGDKGKICASKLIQGRILPKDPYAEFLAQIAQAQDYDPAPGRPEAIIGFGENFQNAISYLNIKSDIGGLTHLVNLLARGRLLRQDKWLSGIISVSGALVEQAREEAFNNYTFLNVRGLKFVLISADAILPEKKILAELRDRFAGEVDGIAVYFMPPSCHVLFYKGTGNDFDAEKFCVFVGGGGREGNGGFTPPEQIVQEGFKSLLTFLGEKLYEFINLRRRAHAYGGFNSFNGRGDNHRARSS